MDDDEFTLALGADPVVTATPVVFCAATEDARQVSCLAAACGVLHILIKPCEPEDIARFVCEILDPSQTPGTSRRRSCSSASNSHEKPVDDRLADSTRQVLGRTPEAGHDARPPGSPIAWVPSRRR
jgi:hypothetical protein